MTLLDTTESHYSNIIKHWLVLCNMPLWMSLSLCFRAIELVVTLFEVLNGACGRRPAGAAVLHQVRVDHRQFSTLIVALSEGWAVAEWWARWSRGPSQAAPTAADAVIIVQLKGPFNQGSVLTLALCRDWNQLFLISCLKESKYSQQEFHNSLHSDCSIVISWGTKHSRPASEYNEVP